MIDLKSTVFIGMIALVIIFLIVQIALSSINFLIVLGIMAALGLGAFIFFTSDLWIPMLFATYDNLCPSVEWYDSSVPVETTEE